MSNFEMHFSNPWLLFVLIPLLLITLIPFFMIPKKFRRSRNRVISVSLHCLVAVFLSCLLAGLYFTFTVPNRDNEIMIVMDSSDSNEESLEDKESYIQTILGVCDDNYKVGIVTFGYDCVYAAPLSFDTDEVFTNYLMASKPDARGTNIASALQFAAAQFENPSNAKIVLLSDGFETDKAAADAAKMVASSGVVIDTVNFPDEEHGEIQIVGVENPDEKIVTGAETMFTLTVESSLEQSVNATVTVTDNNFDDTAISCAIAPGEQTIEIPHIFLSPGEHDIIFRLTTSKPGPDGDDYLTQNNVYQAFMNIVVPESVLILESIAGESSAVLSLLPNTFTKIDVINVNQPVNVPATAKELCEYDQVILCNISNSDLTSPVMPEGFVDALYSYVYDMGGSLFTYGGANDELSDGTEVSHAYNYEDMSGSRLEQMLPIDTVQDYTPPSAIVIVVDSSGSMSGVFDAAVDAAENTAIALAEANPNSYCGVTTFSIDAQEQVRLLPVSRLDEIRAAIDDIRNRIESGGEGGTSFSNAIRFGGQVLAPIDVPIKHMILITDGKPSDSLEGSAGSQQYGQYIDYNLSQGITMSVITLGVSEGSSEAAAMQATAERGDGNYYRLSSDDVDSNTLSVLLSGELAAVEVDQMQEIEFHPQIDSLDSPIFEGLNDSLAMAERIPVLKGYYGTRLKANASSPLTYQYVPIYAEWQFGAGKVGSFMSDIGGEWSDEFLSDSSGNGELLIKNIIDNLAPLTQPEPDVLEFTVRSTTQNFTNRIDVYSATPLNEGESINVKIDFISLNTSSTVNGDYVSASQAYGINGVPVKPVGNGISFDFDIIYTGVYRVTIQKLDSAGNVLADVVSYRTFSYSSEYDGIRDAAAAEELLSEIASGAGGVVQQDPVDTIASFDPLIDRSYDPALVILIVSAVLILLDIAVRKFKFKWLHEIIRDRKAMKELKTTPYTQQGESD